MDFNDFSYIGFSKILVDARKTSERHEYKCCIPGCNNKTLKHSHIVPQCVLKEHLCNADHKLMQFTIDKINPMSFCNTGEIPLEKLETLGIDDAMSMPIFCSEHDNGLFEVYEKNANAIIPDDTHFQILQSLRAIGALRHKEEELLFQNRSKGRKDDFYQGEIYEEEKKDCEYLIRRYDATITTLYDAITNNDFSSFEFTCIELDHLGLAVCDAIINEKDLEKHIYNDNYSKPLKVLYIHLLPKGEHSYFIVGYDKRFISNKEIALLKKWTEKLKKKTDLTTLFDILCHCSNNWCISPDCDKRIIEGLSSYYSGNRMKTLLY